MQYCKYAHGQWNLLAPQTGRVSLYLSVGIQEIKVSLVSRWRWSGDSPPSGPPQRTSCEHISWWTLSKATARLHGRGDDTHDFGHIPHECYNLISSSSCWKANTTQLHSSTTSMKHLSQCGSVPWHGWCAVSLHSSHSETWQQEHDTCE